MMSSVTPKTVDLDALLAEKYPDQFVEKPKQTRPVTLFGQTFDVNLGVNVVAQMNILNPDDHGALSNYLVGLIAEADRQRFVSVLTHHPALSGDAEGATGVLFEIIGQLTEVASGSRPTASSSGSATGTRRKAAVKRSAGS
jgi:hypothetical protein